MAVIAVTTASAPVGVGIDGQDRERFEIDIEIACIRRRHAELHESDTRCSDRPRRCAQQLGGRRRREMPTIAGRRERLVGRAWRAQHDLDGTLVVDHHGQDPPIAVAELAGSGADRDVDPEQPFVGTDRAQRAFCGERSWSRRGDAGAWTG